MRLRWSHCVLYVRELEKMLAFYQSVLGFEVTDRGPMIAGSEDSPELCFLSQVGSEHHQIAFANVRGEGASTTLDHVAFRVDSLADIKALWERLKENHEQTGHDAKPAPITHGNTWSVYFEDPEQNRIEIFCDSPFHVNQPQISPFDITADEKDLREWTASTFRSEPGFTRQEEFLRANRERFGK